MNVIGNAATPLSDEEIEKWREELAADNLGFDCEARYLATVDHLRAENGRLKLVIRRTALTTSHEYVIQQREREIAALRAELEAANMLAMQHQCTPDYEMGLLHGEAATMHVCRKRYGKCLHDTGGTMKIEVEGNAAISFETELTQTELEEKLNARFVTFQGGTTPVSVMGLLDALGISYPTVTVQAKEEA